MRKTMSIVFGIATAAMVVTFSGCSKEEPTPAVTAPEVEAPKVEVPAVEAPAVEAPKVETPAVEKPKDHPAH